MSESGFVRRLVHGVPFYICRALEEIADLQHGFSTRHGGVSSLPDGALNLRHAPWDSSENVRENRRRFLGALRLRAGRLLTLRQVHSDRIHIIGEIPSHWNQPEGDALATELEGAALAVQTADCFPILIADPGGRGVACIHSGWRGTLARLPGKTVEAMRNAFGCDPSRLLAAIGPGIRSCCYGVGEEVADRFRENYPGLPLAGRRMDHPDKYLLDLPGALRSQLGEAGIAPGNLHDLGICTHCRTDEFFSYRAEGPLSGRMMAVIMRVGAPSASSASL
jgi:YfiH family protein